MDEQRKAVLERCAQGGRAVTGVVAIALGGSYARGTAGPDSDLDLGLYYREQAPPDVEAIRRLAAELNDFAGPVVTQLYEWGQWVNGGAWLTIEGQRVDFLYRNVDQLDRVIADCQEGRTVDDFWQQPPYGFFNYIYLGEVHTCRALYDPDGLLALLKARVRVYPEALKRKIVQGHLWSAALTIETTAKLAARGDVYSTVGGLARIAASLTQVLFALNETYFVTDKDALWAIDAFPLRPEGYSRRVSAALAHPGATAAELVKSLGTMSGLCREVVALAGPLHTPRY